MYLKEEAGRGKQSQKYVKRYSRILVDLNSVHFGRRPCFFFQNSKMEAQKQEIVLIEPPFWIIKCQAQYTAQFFVCRIRISDVTLQDSLNVNIDPALVSTVRRFKVWIIAITTLCLIFVPVMLSYLRLAFLSYSRSSPQVIFPFRRRKLCSIHPALDIQILESFTLWLVWPKSSKGNSMAVGFFRKS